MLHQKIRIELFIAFVLLFLTIVPGFAKELTGDVHWSGEVSLQEPIVVSPKARLVIAPGTRIVATSAQVKISVRGRLEVLGTSASPVVFSGEKGWQGLEFMEAPAGSKLTWAEFESAAAAISSFATDFEIDSCRFRDNEFGIRLLRESAPMVNGSVFENNQVGIANEMKSGAMIRGNRFVNHQRTAILASHNSKGTVSKNEFIGNKQGVTLLQRFPDRIESNTFIENEIGIYCNQTQNTPVIENNRFEKNDYGVLNFSFSYPVIRNNRFFENSTAVQNDQYGSPLVENNLFRDNNTALYNYRKSSPKVYLNIFEKNDLVLYCDFSAYPEVKENNFLGNKTGVKLGIYQSADWEKRSGSKKIMQRQASERKSQNPLLAQAPDTFNDFVDVSGNWWGEDTQHLAATGKDGNSELFYDRHDKPEVTYENYGPGVYQLDRIVFTPLLSEPVKGAGPEER